MAQIRSLIRDLPYATRVAKKKKKKINQEYVLALFFLKKEILLLKIKMKSKYRKKKDIIKNTASGGVKY